MHRIFPRALLACIIEGRSPDPQELACVTDRVLREAFGGSPAYGRQHAAAVARAALAGVDTALSGTEAIAA
ncbi:hypothetical protein [Sphingomonas profundi]|uniref:hypothetical protein n=1 Tax=Alterirhizorhabdus profundi TaxID=2681549 RepID=UPI0012E8F47D|nr:hypothetical protein [Sphingomonas profundi]